nr:MAG TPA: helix-turn-helix domain protein [Caudoviricetes sp.]
MLATQIIEYFQRIVNIYVRFFQNLKKRKGGFNLYEKIKRFSKEKGIPIRKLEMMANISQGSICKWGEISPSFDKVVRVSEILGIDVSELIDRKE